MRVCIVPSPQCQLSLATAAGKCTQHGQRRDGKKTERSNKRNHRRANDAGAYHQRSWTRDVISDLCDRPDQGQHKHKRLLIHSASYFFPPLRCFAAGTVRDGISFLPGGGRLRAVDRVCRTPPDLDLITDRHLNSLR